MKLFIFEKLSNCENPTEKEVEELGKLIIFLDENKIDYELGIVQR